MEIPDTLTWRKLNNKPSMNMKSISILAFVLNITQPIIIFLLIYFLFKPKHESITFIICFSLGFILYIVLSIRTYFLNLIWWNKNLFMVYI